MGTAPRFVDLFAGVGGFHRAATRVFPDAECVLAVEWDRDCQKVYARAFPGTPLVGDIRLVLSTLRANGRSPATPDEIVEENLIPAHDILFAGFPCQPFSKGGEQLGLAEDTQGTLFHEIMRIVEARRPRLVVLENVANLVGHDEGRTWATIHRALRDAEYAADPEPLVISPREVKKSLGGAPQNRPRVYIIAADLRRGLTVPSSEGFLLPADLRNGYAWNIAAIFRGHDPGETELDTRELTWLSAWDNFVQVVSDDDLPGFPIWVDAWYGRMRVPGRRLGSVATLQADRMGGLGDASEAKWWSEHVRKNVAFYQRRRSVLDSWVDSYRVAEFPESRRKFEWQARRHHPTRVGRTLRDLLIQLRPSGIRAKPPTYAPALVAMAQTPVVGTGSSWRRIGPSEAAVLQGFTDFRPWRAVMRSDPSFTASVAYKQLGNAVSVGVASLVLHRAVRHLDDRHPGWMLRD